MTNEEKKLQDIVSAIIHRHRMESRINPSWVATESLLQLDPQKVSPEYVSISAHLQLRQIARSILRQRIEEEETAQHEMWPDLQCRYPAARSEALSEPEYVLLEYMTEQDVAYNVQRLRREAVAKRKHAEALEAWGQKRFRKIA